MPAAAHPDGSSDRNRASGAQQGGLRLPRPDVFCGGASKRFVHAMHGVRLARVRGVMRLAPSTATMWLAHLVRVCWLQCWQG